MTTFVSTRFELSSPPVDQKMEITQKFVSVEQAKCCDRIHVYGACYEPDPSCPGFCCGIGHDKKLDKDVHLEWCWGCFHGIYQTPKCLMGCHCCGYLCCKCYCCQCCSQKQWDECCFSHAC